MKPLKPNDVRQMSEPELQVELKKQRQNLFDYRRQAALHQLKDHQSLIVTRHNIARILTVLGAKEKEEAK